MIQNGYIYKFGERHRTHSDYVAPRRSHGVIRRLVYRYIDIETIQVETTREELCSLEN